jgi:hypothetical protein
LRALTAADQSVVFLPRREQQVICRGAISRFRRPDRVEIGVGLFHGLIGLPEHVRATAIMGPKMISVLRPVLAICETTLPTQGAMRLVTFG